MCLKEYVALRYKMMMIIKKKMESHKVTLI